MIVQALSGLWLLGTTALACDCRGHCGQAPSSPRDLIHMFYYPWYENRGPHNIRHWQDRRPEVDAHYQPPLDLPSAYYPLLGAYDSEYVVDQHMRWIAETGSGVVLMSWWGPGSHEDLLVPAIMDSADAHGLKVGFYIEPYGGYYRPVPHGEVTLYLDKDIKWENGRPFVGSRTPFTVADDIRYIVDRYSCHRAFYYRQGRPFFGFFAARMYRNSDQTDWRTVWDELHHDPKYNPFVMAHDVSLKSRILAGGWDAGHDYDVAALLNRLPLWGHMIRLYEQANRTFFLTIGPGYDKSRVRGGTNQVYDRQQGALYERIWRWAMEHKSPSTPVLINSFNEFHEGTAIEPVIPMMVDAHEQDGHWLEGYEYADFEGHWNRTGFDASMAYIRKTREFVDEYLGLTTAVHN